MQRDELVTYLDKYLNIRAFEDFGPQGLQVEGSPEVTRLTASVDAALLALQGAAAAGSQFHLVHHGLFWGDPQRLVGALGRRVRALVQADVSLYGAHLALDAHPEVGNNVELARLLGIRVTDWWSEEKGHLIGVWGEAPAGTEFSQFLAHVNHVLGVSARAAACGPGKVRRVGIVSGAAAEQVAEAARLGIDTFLTGETAHGHFWDAAEWGINVVYAGHYATEVVGLKALCEHLAGRFGLAAEFLDYPTDL